jgi:hypothetical protein
MVTTLSVATTESWEGRQWSMAKPHRMTSIGDVRQTRRICVMVQGAVRSREYQRDEVKHRVFELRAIPEIGALRQQKLSGIRCRTIASSISTILRSCSLPTDLKTTMLSRRLTNSGVKFRRAAAMPAPDIRALSLALLAMSSSEGARKPSPSFTSDLTS